MNSSQYYAALIAIDKQERGIMNHHKWPSIESLAHVVKWADRFLDRNRVFYQGKVKLHGTNAAFRFARNGKVIAQKRGAVTGRFPSDDAVPTEMAHFGFTSFVRDQIEKGPPSKAFRDGLDVIFHGEWCGPGIQKGVACSAVDHKFMAIFAAEVVTDDNERGQFVVDPPKIRDLMGSDFITFHGDTIKVMPYHTMVYEVDFSDKVKLKATAERIDGIVKSIDDKDPLIESWFGVEGIGEGLVFYPSGVTDTETMARLMFKAKGEKHQVTKTRTSAPVDFEKMASIQILVDSIVTDARLEQGLTEVFGEEDPDVRRMGDFLKWVGSDVKKECQEEVAASGFDWKEISKHVTKKAVSYLKAKDSAL